MKMRARLSRFVGHTYRGRGAQRLVRAIYSPPYHPAHSRLHTRVTSRDGSEFLVDTGSLLEWRLFAFGEYEDQLQHAMLERLPPKGVFLDCGANIGIHTCAVARQRPGVRVIAMEPADHILTRLNENISLNRLDNVTVVPTAVGEETGQVQLFLPPRESMNQGQASLSRRSFLEQSGVPVPIDTLDNIAESLGLARIFVIKIDVEGQELKVLRGARRILREDRPTVFFEFDPDSARVLDVPWEPIEGILNELGYEVKGEVGGKMKIAVPIDLPPNPA